MHPFPRVSLRVGAGPANASYIVVYPIVVFPPSPITSLNAPSVHPCGPMFSLIPLTARSASAPRPPHSPTFVFASSLYLVISVFSSHSSLSHFGAGVGVGGLSCLNITNRSLRKEEREEQARRRRRSQAGARKDTTRPKIGGLTEQINKKSHFLNYHPGFSKLPAHISPTGQDCE